jgi:hypothetical protein
VRIGLLLNPFVLALMTDALSDGLSFLLVVLLVDLALCADRTLKNIRQTVFFLTAGTATAAYAVMVRPANLVVLVAWCAACALTIANKPEWQGQRRGVASTFVLCSALVVCVVFGPQFYYNITIWREFSFLPVCRLGDLQVHFGILAWKYDSYVINNAVSSLFYVNPLVNSATTQSPTLYWYTQYPLRGVATAIAHMFVSFSVTNLFTYVYTLQSWYTSFLVFTYWLITVLGTIHGYNYLRTTVLRGKICANTAYLISTILVFLTFAGTAAMNSISAVEIRYNVFPIAVLSVLGVYWILERRAGFDRRSIMKVALALTLALSGAVGSYYIGALARTSLSAESPTLI